LISVSTPVASLYSTDIVEIDVGLQMADLAWIQVPGALARITLDTGSDVLEWRGYVDRTVGVLDEIGRLAQVIVQVDDPFGHESTNQPDLNIGSFVNVEISGRSVKNTIALPRSAIRENSTVWIVDADNLLDIREVSIERLTSSEALIGSGITPGERIVTTFLAGASQGMKLRPVLEEEIQ
jgi:multidrug efflux pump subunit AcrA (membrane-fusion protein)